MSPTSAYGPTGMDPACQARLLPDIQSGIETAAPPVTK